MALWHLYRMETDPNLGPVSLTCDGVEVPIKYTLYDSDGAVYDTIVACVDHTRTPEQLLDALTSAGYTPNDWTP